MTATTRRIAGRRAGIAAALLSATAVLAALILPFAGAAAADPAPKAAAEAPVTLVLMQAAGTVPGFDQIGLERYLARRIEALNLPGWRFQAAGLNAEPAPNRLQWSFRLNPYAGGTIRRIGPGGTSTGLHRYVTVEVRLYLGGDYQTLSSGQTELEGGPDDAKLGALVDNLASSAIRNGTPSPTLPTYPSPENSPG